MTFFDNILNPFGSIDIGSFYLKFASVIDAMIYLMLFLSLAQLVFKKLYKDSKKEAKLVAFAIGLALAVSMTVLELNTGFYIGQLAPVALIIFLLVLAILLYNLMIGLFTGKNGKMISTALTYLIVYGLLVVPFGTLYKWIQKNSPLLSAILALAAIVAFIYLIIELFGVFGGGDSKPEEKKPEEKKEIKPETKPEEKPETKPEEKKEEIKKDEMDKPLDSYVGAVGTFLRENLVPDAKMYSDAGKAVIELHRGNGGRSITAADWSNFQKAESQVYKSMKIFNNSTERLFNDAHYKTLTKKDLDELAKILKEATELDSKIMIFRDEMIKAYNDNAAPMPTSIGNIE